MNNYPNILKATKSDEILAVIENLPVNANGFFLTEEQLANADASIADAVNQIAELQTQLSDNQELLNQAQEAKQTAENALNKANATIATLQEEIKKLSDADGADAEGVGGGADDFEKEKSGFSATQKKLFAKANSAL